MLTKCNSCLYALISLYDLGGDTAEILHYVEDSCKYILKDKEEMNTGNLLWYLKTFFYKIITPDTIFFITQERSTANLYYSIITYEYVMFPWLEMLPLGML